MSARSVKRGWVAIALPLWLALWPSLASAKAVVHVTRAGDTPESIAAEYYGNRALAQLLLEANGLARSAHLRPGKKVKLPTSYHYRVRRGESLEQVAQRLLGDKRRAPFLAQWSNLKPGDRVDGKELLIPFVLMHRATAPESLANVARSLLGDGGQARLLAQYNFRSAPLLAKGETIVVPIPHVRVRSVRLPETPVVDASRETVIPAAPPPEAQHREAELASRVAKRLAEAEDAYRDGRYDDVPAALTKLLSEEDPSEQQLVAIHRLLAFAYVALGADEVAVREFREVLERDPEAKLDPATVSPKIRAAFDRARKGEETAQP